MMRKLTSWGRKSNRSRECTSTAGRHFRLSSWQFTSILVCGGWNNFTKTKFAFTVVLRWTRVETISRESMRSGEFKVRGLSSNTMTAVRVFVSCSRGQPIVSNTVYAWTKVTADDPECFPIKTHLEPNTGTQLSFVGHVKPPFRVNLNATILECHFKWFATKFITVGPHVDAWRKVEMLILV